MVLESAESIDEESIRQAGLKHGMHTLRMAGADLLRNGISTLEEVASITIEDE